MKQGTEEVVGICADKLYKQCSVTVLHFCCINMWLFCCTATEFHI